MVRGGRSGEVPQKKGKQMIPTATAQTIHSIYPIPVQTLIWDATMTRKKTKTAMVADGL